MNPNDGRCWTPEVRVGGSCDPKVDTPSVPRPERRDRPVRLRGSSLAELVVTLALSAGMMLAVIPALTTALHRATLHNAGQHVLEILVEAQNRAATSDRYCGVRFSLVDGEWWYTMYEDGNGNGILAVDITSGIDTPIAARDLVFPSRTRTRIGYTPGTVNFDTGKPMMGDESPVNFNKSTICSFSPGGSGTPGSVYFTDGVYGAMVRSSGDSGRVRAAFYHGKNGGWQE
jgi:Tfp pilus assembly protein FimT